MVQVAGASRACFLFSILLSTFRLHRKDLLKLCILIARLGIEPNFHLSSLDPVNFIGLEPTLTDVFVIPAPALGGTSKLITNKKTLNLWMVAASVEKGLLSLRFSPKTFILSSSSATTVMYNLAM
jgi:hypothetical protein